MTSIIGSELIESAQRLSAGGAIGRGFGDRVGHSSNQTRGIRDFPVIRQRAEQARRGEFHGNVWVDVTWSSEWQVAPPARFGPDPARALSSRVPAWARPDTKCCFGSPNAVFTFRCRGRRRLVSRYAVLFRRIHLLTGRWREWRTRLRPVSRHCGEGRWRRASPFVTSCRTPARRMRLRCSRTPMFRCFM